MEYYMCLKKKGNDNDKTDINKLTIINKFVNNYWKTSNK